MAASGPASEVTGVVRLDYSTLHIIVKTVKGKSHVGAGIVHVHILIVNIAAGNK